MKEENLRKFHGRFLEYFTENWFRTVSVIGQSGAVFLRHLKKKTIYDSARSDSSANFIILFLRPIFFLYQRKGPLR